MEWLLDHLRDLTPASVHLTLAGILLLCGLGLPIPEDISLISGGYMAHLGVVSVHTVFLVCLAAVLGGDSIAFLLGYQFGRRLLQWGPARRLFSARKQLRVRAYFRKYGSKVIFIGRFLPGLRFSIFFSAGTLHVKAATFLLYDTLAALLSVPFLVYLAYYFGEHIDNVIAWARRSEYGILVLAIVATAFVLFKIVRHRRLRKKELSAPPPGASATSPAPTSAQDTTSSATTLAHPGKPEIPQA
jgi:membrane protein DedA with SNARE-associated domain